MTKEVVKRACSTNRCYQISVWSRYATPCANLSFSFHLFLCLFVSLAFLFTSSFSSAPIFVPLYSSIFINLVQLLVLAKRHSRDICKYEFQKWWMTTFALNLCTYLASFGHSWPLLITFGLFWSLLANLGIVCHFLASSSLLGLHWPLLTSFGLF